MKLLIEFFEVIDGVEQTFKCILDKFETDEFFTYQDYLYLFPTGNILGACDDKGRIIPNRFGIDLSKYCDDLQLNSLCDSCKYKDNCNKHHDIIDDCQVRHYIAAVLSDSKLYNEVYYKAEDELVSLSDTYFKWSILFDPVKNILKGGE